MRGGDRNHSTSRGWDRDRGRDIDRPHSPTVSHKGRFIPPLMCRSQSAGSLFNGQKDGPPPPLASSASKIDCLSHPPPPRVATPVATKTGDGPFKLDEECDFVRNHIYFQGYLIRGPNYIFILSQPSSLQRPGNHPMTSRMPAPVFTKAFPQIRCSTKTAKAL